MKPPLYGKNQRTPVYNAIVWQCRRTAEITDKLKKPMAMKNIFVIPQA